MSDLSTGEVTEPPTNGKDILNDSDGKIRMQYVISDTNTDVGDGTKGTMDVTLTAIDTPGFLDPGFLADSGGMVGAQATIGIPKYRMIVKC